MTSRRPTAGVLTPCPSCPEPAVEYLDRPRNQLRIRCPACGYSEVSPNNARLQAAFREVLAEARE